MKYFIPLFLFIFSAWNLPLNADGSDISDQNTITINALLFNAIAQGDPYAMNHYIDQGADLNAQFGDAGDTPLLLAIKCLKVLVHQYEQKIFSDPHTFNIAYANRIAIIRTLIFHPEVDCSLLNYRGESPLSIATQEGLNAVAELLLKEIQLHSLDNGDDLRKAREQLDELDIDEETYDAIEDAISKAFQSSHEAGKQAEYLKCIFSLPWDERTETQKTLNEVQEILEQDHYGLKKVKDKILEYLAVSLLTPKAHTKILCLVGPPGTGKTSIAESIAKSLNRNFTKTSLGGVHEERAIRGHNKGYVGAEPGDILKGIKKAGSKNCVFLLDEIDKLGTQNQWSGNPAAALLEVLDREQNKHFLDHYLDIPFDLSEVLFITTANNYRDIPRPLLDRMEIVELTSYTDEEKFNIAKKYLLPKALNASGLIDKEFTLDDDVVKEVIESYTYEAGVRRLAEALMTLCSKAARSYLETGALPTVTTENLIEFLGAGNDRKVEEEFLREDSIGVSNALYATGVKGGVGFIETSVVPGKGSLTLTGNLGKTFQESAKIALSYAQAHAQELGIEAEMSKHDVHIHIIPSHGTEGPSAGAALLSSLVSAFAKKPYNRSYAMTGELSLTGKILPIGGLKEKLLGAKKNGVTKVIVPRANEADLFELKDITEDMEITVVSHANEVLNKVLLPPLNGK